jgi:hypothetical protein
MKSAAMQGRNCRWRGISSSRDDDDDDDDADDDDVDHVLGV